MKNKTRFFFILIITFSIAIFSSCKSGEKKNDETLNTDNMKNEETTNMAAFFPYFLIIFLIKSKGKN